MASVLIGKGNAVGMFYVAVKGTALPSTPDTAPGAGWKKVGDVSSDGISMSLPSGDVIKNWAIDRTFEPAISAEEREERVAGWNKAVKCSYGWAK